MVSFPLPKLLEDFSFLILKKFFEKVWSFFRFTEGVDMGGLPKSVAKERIQI